MGLAIGEAIPSALADASVLDGAGRARPLGAAWRERDALVVFVRHFACAGCAEHIAALRPRLGELAALATGVTLVGNGSAAQLAAFVEREQLAGYAIDAVTDPTLAAYRAAGFARSRATLFGPRNLASLVGLLAKGYANGATEGDLAQQGGTLYVRRGGELAFLHRSARVGDRARLVDVVAIALASHAAQHAERLA